MAISPQQLTIYLYSTHRAVIFAIALHSFLVFRKVFAATLRCIGPTWTCPWHVEIASQWRPCYRRQQVWRVSLRAFVL